jgi:flagellar biosynthesis protein FliR
MVIALYILFSYLISVCAYTFIVRNDAMHKHNPHTSTWSIMKEGMKGMAIGFVIAIAIISAVYYAASLLLTAYYC